ncbi:hypothetical protein [Methylocystis parvus]|uniref:hypothetical protein n=1 Tax=Methylocystis parvus TaxID=134 RepID=UPI003C757994
MSEHDAMSKKLPDLGPKTSDHAAATLRAAANLVPIFGAGLAEIVTNIIPNQRLDRIERYLSLLRDELLAKGLLEDSPKLAHHVNVAIIEDGAFQAARSLSDQRTKFIARCVAEGISAEEAEKIRERKLLRILGELDDEEIMVLRSISSNDWSLMNDARPEPPYIGCSEKVARDNVLWDQSFERLEQLGLIHFRQIVKKVDSFSSLPEYDAFGKRKGYYLITALGAYLLQHLRQ